MAPPTMQKRIADREFKSLKFGRLNCITNMVGTPAKIVTFVSPSARAKPRGGTGHLLPGSLQQKWAMLPTRWHRLTMVNRHGGAVNRSFGVRPVGAPNSSIRTRDWEITLPVGQNGSLGLSGSTRSVDNEQPVIRFNLRFSSSMPVHNPNTLPA